MRCVILALVGGALAGCGGVEPMGLMATIQTADGRRVDFAGEAKATATDVVSIAASDPVTGWRLTVTVPPRPGDYVLGKDRPTVQATWSGNDALATSGRATVLSIGNRGELIVGTLTDVHLDAGDREVCVVSAATFSARLP